jgi:hypothetical protein
MQSEIIEGASLVPEEIISCERCDSREFYAAKTEFVAIAVRCSNCDEALIGRVK